MSEAECAVVMILHDNAALMIMCERLQAENDKLMSRCERLQAENAKLRKLVRDMHRAICGLVVLGDDYAGEYEDKLCALDDRMQEFGIEP